MEKKLALDPGDKDMIIMLHEIAYEWNGKEKFANSHLIVKGDDSVRTAMAKTVGLPLGIAAGLLLDGRIERRGVTIPIHKDIYQPVLSELRSSGIGFQES